MGELELSKEATEQLVSKVKRYFLDELDQDIGSFEAEFLIDFFVREVGPQCYNSGLADAHALFADKSEEIGYLVQELEKPIG
mgnify:CR=1 FL=1